MIDPWGRPRTDAGSATAGHGFTLHLPLSDLAMSVARSAVRRVFTFDRRDAESAYLVALTEIVANAVDEHRRTAPGEPIAIDVRLGPCSEVTVRDHGTGLGNALAAGSPSTDLGPTAESGRGLTLARAFVPDLRFVSTGTGTSAVLPLEGSVCRADDRAPASPRCHNDSPDVW